MGTHAPGYRLSVTCIPIQIDENVYNLNQGVHTVPVRFINPGRDACVPALEPKHWYLKENKNKCVKFLKLSGTRVRTNY